MYYSHSSPLQEISPTSRCFGNSNLNISDINNYLSFQTEEMDQEVDKNAMGTCGAKLQQTSRHSNVKFNINPHTNFKYGRPKQKDCFEINRQQMLTKISKGSLNEADFTNSNKENVPLNSIVETKSSLEISPCVNFTKDMSLDKEVSSSLFQEFSLYNDFSASVREMLHELGLKPPVNGPLENVERNLSIECIPKPLSLLENTVLMSKLEKIDCIVPSLNCSNLSSRNRLTNQICDLEKEVFRRKHCEHLIKDLQQKLLNNEQEFALVSALNEKKSLVIKELRQILDNLAIAWKKLEDSQMETIKELQNECDDLKESLKQKNEKLENTENALSSMKENISELNCKLSEKEEKLNSEILHNEDMKKTLNQLRDKLQKETTFVEELKIEVATLQKRLEKEQHASLQKSSEFDQSRQKLQQQLLEEIEKKNELQTKLDEVAFSLEMMSADNFALKEQLELITKEKNFAEEELRRRESEYIGQEIEWKSKMDKKVNELEMKYEEKEKHLKEQLETKYEAEISACTSEYENWKEEELSKYEIKIQELKDYASVQNEEIQQQLKVAEMKTANLRYKIEKIESGRSQMISQLQSFLQSIWKNSFQLFYGTFDTSQGEDSSSDGTNASCFDYIKSMSDDLVYQSISNKMNSKSECKVHKDYTVTPLTLNLYTDSDFGKFPEMDKKLSINEQKTYHQYQNIYGTYSDMSRDQHKCCSTNEKNLIINSPDFIENIKCTNCQKYAEMLHSMCYQCKKKISMIPCKDCYNSQQFHEEDERIADYIQLHTKNSSEENVKQPSSQKDNYYIQMLQAEKPDDVCFQPVTKEIVNIPFSKPNSINCSETNSLEQLTSTLENNSAKIVRKTCVVSTKMPLEKQKILLMKEDHNLVKDVKSIYSNPIRYDSKIKFKDMEKYNKLHPWK